MSAFSGIRILDFTQGIAGPMATMLLADFEAEVIKVEPPAGDRVKDHAGYLTWNRNKKRLKLDLTKFEGLQAARQLIATADVAVFDNRPGELERLGFDSTTVCADFPSLVHVWMPPYGEHGRWSQLPPDEMLIELATHLYASRRLNMGQAKRLAKLDLMSFQKELAKRNICINYTVEDLRNDVATLDKLFERTVK